MPILAILLAISTIAAPSKPIPVGKEIGQGLLDACSRKPGKKYPDVEYLSKHSRCYGYISAVIDQLVSEQGSLIGRDFCNSDADFIEDYVEAIQAYYRRHPGELRMLAAPRIKTALRQAFPCQ